ncbi:MAG: hypothetical protein QOD39_4623 [Mycobacterium sp.]|nr:hypothetical protein [Mycobacterium sp.]
MLVDQAPASGAFNAGQSPALVTTATSQPALRTGFAVLGLVSLLDLPKAERADRMVALGGAAAAGWFLVRAGRRRWAPSRRPGISLS